MIRKLSQTQTFDTITIVTSESSTPQTIQHKDADEAHKTLGTMLCPPGNQQAEAQRMLLKSRHNVNIATSMLLTTDEGWNFYFAKWLMAMSYSLPATFLTQQQCNKIMACATGMFLNTLHYPRTFARAITFAPIQSGGVGLRDLWVEQGSVHVVKVLLAYGRSRDNILWNTLIVTYRWYHQMCGTTQHPFATPQLLPLYTPEGWFLETHRFLKESNIGILWPQLPDKHSQYNNDVNIMEYAMSHVKSPSEMKKINACRIYCRGTFLSDFCYPDGQRLHNKWLFPSMVPLRTTVDQWPIQSKPNEATWTVFRRFLRRAFCQTNRSNILRHRLRRKDMTTLSPITPIYDTFLDYIQRLPPFETALLSNIGEHRTPHL